MTPIDDILSDDKGEAAPEEGIEPIESEAAQANPEGEAASTETPAEEAEPEGAEDPKGWQYAAYKDEKTKRQELERSASVMKQQLAEAQRREQEWQHHLQRQQQPIQTADELLSTVDQRMNQTEATMRRQMSETVCRQAHGDEAVDAALKAFEELGVTNPQHQQALAEQHGYGQNPIDGLVKWHKQQQALSEIGDDPNAYREKLKAELLQELQGASPEQVLGKPKPNSAAMPTDFSQSQSMGKRTGSNWSGPTPLGSILGEG